MANTEWEMSIIELKEGKRKRYKITRRMPEMKVAETKVFKSKKKALAQLQEWLS